MRKSVGQGYRTQSALEEAKLRSDRAALVSKASSSSQGAKTIESRRGGIMIMVDGNVLIDEEDEDGFPSSSQDSLTSVESMGSVKIATQALPRVAKKRGFDIDEEDGLDDEVLFGERMDAVSTCLRPIAQAKSRIQTASATKSNAGMKSRNSTTDFGDFDEADFLVALHQE